MKKIVSSIWILAISICALSSCVEEEGLSPQNDNSEMINIEITAGSPVTKTHLDGTMQVKWDTDIETMVIFENSVENRKESTATGPDNDPAGNLISPDGSTATFNVEFPSKTGGEFNYWGLYPASSLISVDNADLNKFKMQIPSTQKPKATTFDYKADLLISKKITKSSQPSSLSISLARPIAIVEMTLKGIGEGENISEVIFSSESAPITGQLTYNMNTNEVIAYGIDGQKKITLNTNLTAASSGTKIYFTALPAVLNDFTVIVKTDKATYSKSVDCSGKNLAFKANTFTKFSVNNMTRNVIAKPVLTINWDMNAELDNKGGIFTIPYTIENPVEGASLVLSTMNGILQNLKAESGKITFSLDANPEQEVRKDYLFCEYKKGEEVLASKNLTIIQAANQSNELTFALQLSTIKDDGIYIYLTPSDLTATYVVETVEKDVFDSMTPESYIQSRLDEWKAYYEPISNHLKMGELSWEKIPFKRLGTAYYVVVYGLNEDGTITTKDITKAEFQSPKPAPYISFSGWDNTATQPKAGGHVEVIVNINNTDSALELQASTTASWITHIVVSKVTDSQYNVQFDAGSNPSYSSREGKVKLQYGSVTKNIIYYQSGF